ncbi:MAG: pilus assembly protein, partial [Desulfuromonadales bacterium]|nr:pilus assembly protein [Desulfuromonadales bacterium]
MFAQKERGTALVEFSLVLPLLLMVLFGIIEFSILFYDKAVITNASREAAREWVVYRDVRWDSDQIAAVVDNYTQDRM